MRKTGTILIFVCLIITFGSAVPALAQESMPEDYEVAATALDYDPWVQPADLFYNEAMTVYLTNLERRKVGAPPLRWNRETTLGGRWFSWDSTENRRPNGYCGHQDTWGLYSGDRSYRYGYRASAGAENAMCGFTSPEGAVYGWMHSTGHRDNLLNPSHQEIGLGYYRSTLDGRGYIAQVFALDAAAPPVIIENELPATATPNVTIYTRSNNSLDGFMSLAPAQEMRIDTDACLTDQPWIPYQAERSITLSPGEGWKTIYVQVRDKMSRTATVSDTIYYGAAIPTNQITLDHLSQTRSSVTLYGLNGGGYPYAQFSPGWMVDNTHNTFTDWDGNHVINTPDPAALGGSAFVLDSAHNWAWAWEYGEFEPNTSYVAYFRLKINSNTSSDYVANFTVDPGTGSSTPSSGLSVRGTDFHAAGQYQEFALPFTYTETPQDSFVSFGFNYWGNASVWIDAVRIFSASVPFSSTYTWNPPDAHYRGQGILVRYTDENGNFTDAQEASTVPPTLNAGLSQVRFLAEQNQPSNITDLPVFLCSYSGFSVSSAPAWLQISTIAGGLRLQASARSSAGQDNGSLVLASTPAGQTLTIPVTRTVVTHLNHQYLPSVLR